MVGLLLFSHAGRSGEVGGYQEVYVICGKNVSRVRFGLFLVPICMKPVQVDASMHNYALFDGPRVD